MTEKVPKKTPPPAIFIVATPIGNLEDLTIRAVNTLKNADIITAEDTRQARKLLTHLKIHGKELVSYHDHIEATRAPVLLDRIEREKLILALVSDAGTPCISDPGYRLVAAAKERGIPVHPIPGPSALTALASAAGLPTDRLLFIGFPPPKAKDLDAEIKSWRQSGGASVIFFAPTRRLGPIFAAIHAVYPSARIAIGRELTKLFEEILLVPIADAETWAAKAKEAGVLKGEAAVMVALGDAEAEATEKNQADEAEQVMLTLKKQIKSSLKTGASVKDIIASLGMVHLKRNELYELILTLKKEM